MKKYAFMILSFLFTSCAMNLPVDAAEQNALPEAIGKNIAAEFRPESAAVTVKGQTAWIEINGGTIDGIRIDKMKLLAVLQEVSAPDGSTDSTSYLAQMIKSSKGEVVLAEKDVNDYFKKNENPEGFSGLQFDFKKEGYSASGKFRTKIIVDMELPISAKGVLGLHDDGVYLENTVIKVEGMSQPEFLTNMIVSKLNPLLEFKDIPFPVTFEKITMTEKAAIMTGEPKEFKGGDTWKWKNLQ
ncbi:MAG: LmeA family phospholipid-binding protein [Synergistaceae bacterium]